MAKFWGMGFIILVIPLAIVASLTRRPIVRFVSAVAAVTLWASASLAFVGLLAIEHSDISVQASLSCPVKNNDSEFVPSHWSYLPPGVVCEYPLGEVGPTYWRIPAAVVLIAVPISFVVFRPLRRRRSTEAIYLEDRTGA
ncbi:MAG TPA: hypothetical protein VL856_09375 [Acidimicrobiia bacterium]|jgi:hypothetical protein|nr:hypothetical protein [Acidimicrobiia bacterium]